MTLDIRSHRSSLKSTQTRSSNARISSTLIISFALLLVTGQAHALWTEVTATNLHSCDPLGLSARPDTDTLPIDELGTDNTTFGGANDELIKATSISTTQVACPNNAVTIGIEVSITNATSRKFTDLWYVADGHTSITNTDGLINDRSAFKIDRIGMNRPLIFESDTASPNDGIFSPGEVWTFIIDNYQNSLGPGYTADQMGSVGVGWLSDEMGTTLPLSSGSIVALVPEPGTALLVGLGLTGLSLAGRSNCRRIEY